MNSIYKIENGPYIDLDKLIHVSEAYFIDRMGFGGWYVGFKMEFQLRETAIEFIRELNESEFQYDDEKGRHLLKLTNNELAVWVDDYKEVLAVSNMQKIVNTLVFNWQVYRQSQAIK